MPALLPYLHHLHPASANLLHHVGTAAQQATQLAAVLDMSSQVQTATFNYCISGLCWSDYCIRVAFLFTLKVRSLCWFALLLGRAWLCFTVAQLAE